MKKKIIWLLVVIIHTYCTSVDDKYPFSDSDLSLQLIDSLIIRVNDQTNVQGPVQLISYTGKELLSCFAYKDGYNNYYLYDVEKGEYYGALKYATEGDKGVGRLSPVILVVSSDSIYVYRINSNIFYRVDSTGNVHEKIDLSFMESGTIYCSAWFPPRLLDNKLHFFRIGADDPNSRKFLANSRAEGIYDLKTGRYENDWPPYPDYPRGYELSMENWKVSRCIGSGGAFVYSFPFDNQIYVYRGERVEPHKIPNEMRALVKSIPAIDPMSFESQMQFIASIGMYTHLLYDSFNRVYYRVYLQPGAHKDEEGNVIKVADFSWSLEIIDEEFRLRGRYSFPPKKYNPYNVLISRRGIMVSNVNAYNPQKEDYLIYHIYNLKRTDS